MRSKAAFSSRGSAPPESLAILRVPVLVTVAVLLVLAAVTGAAIAVTGNHEADRVSNYILNRTATRAADLTAAQLTPPVVAIEQIARVVESGESASLEHLLAASVDSMDSVSGAYVATVDGDFHFVRRAGDHLILKRIDPRADPPVVESTLDSRLDPSQFAHASDDYNFVNRPWYRSAIADPGAISWTDPYVFFSSRLPGVTASLAVRDGTGKVTAVVALDITLDFLSGFVSNLPIDQTAQAYIFSGLSVIAAPRPHKAVIDTGVNELTLASPADVGLSIQDGQVVGNEGDKTARHDVSGHGLPHWTVIVRANHIELVDIVHRQTRIALAVTALAVIVLAVPLVAVYRRARRPIQDLATRADRDQLTDLPSLQALRRKGAEAIDSGTDVVLALLNVQWFESVNDDFGQPEGDNAIKRLAQRLRDAAPSDSFVSRIGGVTFGLLLADPDSVVGVKAALDDELYLNPRTSGCTVLVGISRLDGRDEVSIDQLLHEADAQLRENKRQSRRR